MKNYYLKNQVKLVNNLDKSQLRYGEYEDTIFYTLNGFVGYFIPKQDFIIDISKIKKAVCFAPEKLFNNNKEYEIAQYIGTIVDKNRELVVLKSSVGKVYLDPQLFKEFKGEDFIYFTSGERDNVKICLCGKLYAILYPVRRIEADTLHT